MALLSSANRCSSDGGRALGTLGLAPFCEATARGWTEFADKIPHRTASSAWAFKRIRGGHGNGSEPGWMDHQNCSFIYLAYARCTLGLPNGEGQFVSWLGIRKEQAGQESTRGGLAHESPGMHPGCPGKMSQIADSRMPTDGACIRQRTIPPSNIQALERRLSGRRLGRREGCKRQCGGCRDVDETLKAAGHEMATREVGALRLRCEARADTTRPEAPGAPKWK